MAEISEKELQYDGLRVAYIEAGSGPLVVVFHGWGANKELYQDILQVLAPRYRVVIPDVPGFGESEEPAEPWDLEAYSRFAADFTERMLADTADKKVILIGHSHGGRFLIRLVGGEALPFQIEKMVLIDSAGIVPEKTPEQLRRIRRYKRRKAFLGTRVMRTLFPKLLETIQSKSGSEDYRNATPVMRQSLVKVVNTDVREYLPRIQAETLLIWGERDTATPLADGRLMERMMPRAGLAVFPGAGHFPFIDNRAQFLAVMRSFFEIET